MAVVVVVVVVVAVVGVHSLTPAPSSSSSFADRPKTRNWPETRVDLVVLTDGERVLGFGDLGVHGMGVCVSKIAMYTACGGLHPQRCLPICIDVGTNNKELLDSPFYVGYHHTRVRGEEYNELLEETISEIHLRFGHKTFIQFEDFSFENSARFLREYRADAPVYDDDIQGEALIPIHEADLIRISWPTITHD